MSNPANSCWRSDDGSEARQAGFSEGGASGFCDAS
jgi:hypothetical protein